MEQEFPFARVLLRYIHINHINEPNLLTLRVSYPRISMLKDFCLWWCDFQKPSHCASFQGRDWCGQPKVKIVIVYNTIVFIETCKRGKSSVCPRSSLNPASSVKTDPSPTLKISAASVYQCFSPVKVPVDENLQPPICARSCLPNLFICRSSSVYLTDKTLD